MGQFILTNQIIFHQEWKHSYSLGAMAFPFDVRAFLWLNCWEEINRDSKLPFWLVGDSGLVGKWRYPPECFICGPSRASCKPVFCSFVSGSVVICCWIFHFLWFIWFRISLKIKNSHVIRFCFFPSPWFHSSDSVSHGPVTFETDKSETFLPFGIPLSFRSPSPLVSLQAVKDR